MRALRARIRKLGADRTVVEKFIEGPEFSVAMLGDEVLAASEMRFTSDPPIVTYDEKWIDDSPENAPVVHRPVPARLARTARAAAKAVSPASSP